MILVIFTSKIIMTMFFVRLLVNQERESKMSLERTLSAIDKVSPSLWMSMSLIICTLTLTLILTLALTLTLTLTLTRCHLTFG